VLPLSYDTAPPPPAQCSEDSESYLKYEHFRSNIDIFQFFFMLTHFDTFETLLDSESPGPQYFLKFVSQKYSK